MDPDGTLASRREFDNSLTGFGASLVAKFLAREKSVGEWRISLSSSDNPCLKSGSANSCVINESTSSKTGDHRSYDLTISSSSADLVLTGTATAARDGEIATVTTGVFSCTAGSIGCEGSGASSSFSAVTLSSAETVSEGQSIQVTVTFTFS